MGRTAFILVAGLVIGIPAHAQMTAPNWSVSDTKSELDGAESYVATVKATAPVANLIDRSDYPILGVSCSAKGYFLSLIWPDFIAKSDGIFGGDVVSVTWRIDTSTIQHTTFSALDQSAVLVGNKGRSWLTNLKGASRLIVRVPDKHGGQEASFDIAGVDQIVDALSLRNCG